MHTHHPSYAIPHCTRPLLFLLLFLLCLANGQQPLYELCGSDPICSSRFYITTAPNSRYNERRFERLFQLYVTELGGSSNDTSVWDPSDWKTLALLRRASFCGGRPNTIFLLGSGCVQDTTSSVVEDVGRQRDGDGDGARHMSREYLVVYVLIAVVFSILALYNTFVCTDQSNALLRAWNNYRNEYAPPEPPTPPPSLVVHSVQHKLGLPR